ncbi:uncharacterized protein LOC108200474 isoform X4 [Daucus carota subsp. sativus]|uniref:uncharacterized protein LOC108200474 isoform X4 n=1 Tax=Daucus carota subsp. sativus TaxID=79200 RepID=UPI0030837524
MCSHHWKAEVHLVHLGLRICSENLTRLMQRKVTRKQGQNFNPTHGTFLIRLLSPVNVIVSCTGSTKVGSIVTQAAAMKIFIVPRNRRFPRFQLPQRPHIMTVVDCFMKQ